MQRKVFRIEQTMAGRGERRRLAAQTPAAPDRDLIALHDLVARHKRDLAALLHDGEQRRMTTAAGELGAAIESMEKATQGILKSAESVDSDARTLGAAAKDDHERALAQDIQEHVAQIYEACNFQDLAGQRIGKVIEMLGMVEAQLADMVAHGNAGMVSVPPKKAEAGLINGPKLDGASGHASQHDIDMLFG